MAGYQHGDNNFSDDELDDLPASALQELENNAIQFTQAANANTQASHWKAPPSSDYGDDFNDEDLDDAVVIDEARSTPAVLPVFNQNTAHRASQQEQFRPPQYRKIPLLNRPRANVPIPIQHSQNRPPHLISQYDSALAQQGSLPEPGEEVDDLQKQIQEVGHIFHATL
jgi:hypothetical protein